MSAYIPWSSQPLDSWAGRYARGTFVDLEGRSTHYLERGEGEPVILLHGFLYDSYLWADNIEALARHFKVYALDLWGCGYSTREPLDYGYELYAHQLSLFMDSLGIPRASLVGQSMGAGTAIKFCVEQRQRVNKLLLVDPSGLPNPLPWMGKFFNLPRIGEFFLGLNTDIVRKQALRDSFIHDSKRITDDYFENVTRAHKIAGTTDVLLTILRKQFFGTLSDEIGRLAQIETPVLIVWGRQDKAIPLRCGEEMHRILKGSCLEILDHAGHVPNFERAAEFNQLAVDFLRA
ncbi:MAG TPA: alpha/beta fold hydrolase [Thermoanaerobaculia bacterium]